jgi:magnesium-transporting ATPase (P-type)
MQVYWNTFKKVWVIHTSTLHLRVAFFLSLIIDNRRVNLKGNIVLKYLNAFNRVFQSQYTITIISVLLLSNRRGIVSGVWWGRKIYRTFMKRTRMTRTWNTYFYRLFVCLDFSFMNTSHQVHFVQLLVLIILILFLFNLLLHSPLYLPSVRTYIQSLISESNS